MAFFSRVMNYVFNELLVDALANSKTFQRFAVRTDKALREAQASGKISKLADAPTEAAKTMSEFFALGVGDGQGGGGGARAESGRGGRKGQGRGDIVRCVVKSVTTCTRS